MTESTQVDCVSYEPKDEMVFVELNKGKIELSIWMTNEGEESEAMMPVITAWAEDTNFSIIAPKFSVSSPLDYLIEGHKMPAHGNAIDMDVKPIFDALRAELFAQIERIDALLFKQVDS